MMNNRRLDVDNVYSLLDKVVRKFPLQSLEKLGSFRLPDKGVYFFFEDGETRDDKTTKRVVRIGTHAAIANSKASLYDRLYNHKGSKDFTGNHRGSVFRKLIGLSLSGREQLDFMHWGDRSKRNDALVKRAEKQLEIKVSKYLHGMRFTVLEVRGPSSKDNDRALIEENTIALLSNFNKVPIDRYSRNWLGLFSKNTKVISSGFWNCDCVDKTVLIDRYFTTFEEHVHRMRHWS